MSSKLKVDTRVTVETPEGVDFQFVIAGPGKRATSFFLDMIIKFGAIAVGFVLMGLLSAYTGGVSGVGMGMALLIWFAMSWLYGSCCEAFWNGQTVGKRAQHLRVVRTNGTPIGWFEAFGRNLLLVADGMLVLGPIALNTVGLLSMAGTKRMQRLGDLVFDTMVIDESREFISRAADITHGVEPLQRSECTGRFQVPERTLAVIERLFEGDRLISDGRREEIARTVSMALRQRLGYEERGPDPNNPNTYFAQTPLKHTTFLRRVLKTFTETEQDTSRQPQKQSTAKRPIRVPASDADAAKASSKPLPIGNAESEPATDDFLEELQLEDLESDITSKPGLPADWRPSS